MRKAIGILLIVVVVGIFSWVTFQQFTSEDSKFSISNLFKKNQEEGLEDIATRLQTDYPSPVRDVIETYNKLLEIYYKTQLEEDQLELYVETTRKFYSNELNQLNPMEKQLEALRKEEKIDLVASQIQDVYIQVNEDKEEVRAEVIMIYATGSGSFTRNYNLIKEDECWKINSWKDYPIYQGEEETSE